MVLQLLIVVLCTFSLIFRVKRVVQQMTLVIIITDAIMLAHSSESK